MQVKTLHVEGNTLEIIQQIKTLSMNLMTL